MFHLFNSVYVDSEQRINRYHNTIDISPTLGYEFFPPTNSNMGKQIAYAQSLKDWDEDKFYEVFDQVFGSKEKTFVYCDGETYLRLFSLLVKAMLPKATLDVWRWLFLCKKANFQVSVVANGEPLVEVLSSVVINDDVIQKLHKMHDPLLPAMKRLVEKDSHALSLEWHVLKLVVEGVTGKVPRATKHILRRIALSNAHDAMEVWGRQITRPQYWDEVGADIDTLLNAESVFQGCVNHAHMSNPILTRPGMYDFKPNDTWLSGMLDEAATMMDMLEDESSAKRARMIKALLMDTADIRDPVVCLKRVVDMFAGEHRIALAYRDSGKYDEGMIRYFLREDKAVLAAALDGATW